MATFRGHLRKKKASIKSGAGGDDIYKPIWFAFGYMESFLCPIYDCQATINTQDTICAENENVDPTAQQLEANNDNQPVNSTPSFQQTFRRRKNPPKVREAENQMKEAFTLLKDVVSRKDEVTEDECSLYGKLLAKKLRKLPDFERECLMHDIDGMVLHVMQRSLSSSGSSAPFSRSTSVNTDFNVYTSNQQRNTQDLDAVTNAAMMTFEHS